MNMSTSPAATVVEKMLDGDEGDDSVIDADALYGMDDAQLEKVVGCGIEDVYNNWTECTLRQLKLNPGKLYHYTTEEKFREIQEDGFLRGSYGTGLSNRYTHGLFTTTNAEELADGVYGDVCLEIDMDAFKKAHGLAELNLAYEPEVDTFLLREAACAKLDLSCHLDLSSDSGVSPYTIVVKHVIPLKFVTVSN